jgi:hypothetical protein
MFLKARKTVYALIVMDRFVCSFRTGNSETAILRTYENDEPELLFDDCKYGKHVGLPQLQQHSLTQSRLALSTKSLWMAE